MQQAHRRDSRVEQYDIVLDHAEANTRAPGEKSGDAQLHKRTDVFPLDLLPRTSRMRTSERCNWVRCCAAMNSLASAPRPGEVP